MEQVRISLNLIDMRKCSIMFVLFILFLVIASKVMNADNELNENLVVELEIKEQPITIP
ncbi:hypothetical protein [uncultured Maribacter sp.]|uniref:hypothetical protein n=1 Tax=uncultured Maribacter sp. TaxID=431308 RepID=UPI0030EF6A98|tara:strand:- start:57508 stop:57684 length:177 start_codon:yes stop_codon:yes gene_type:complete